MCAASLSQPVLSRISLIARVTRDCSSSEPSWHTTKPPKVGKSVTVWVMILCQGCRGCVPWYHMAPDGSAYGVLPCPLAITRSSSSFWLIFLFYLPGAWKSDNQLCELRAWEILLQYILSMFLLQIEHCLFILGYVFLFWVFDNGYLATFVSFL